MLSVLGFIVILGPLVIVHEFGHFIFAKIFGVKAEIFSVGFGPKLWSRQYGETEFRVSAIPLGGYVKLFGEERDSELSPEDKKRALQFQAPWKRFFIFFGGPLFNFLFAIVIFMAILVIGEPQMASTIGRVVRGSEAEKAGLQSGDRIVAIDDQAVRLYEEVIHKINESPGRALTFKVVRQNLGSQNESVEKNLNLTPSIQKGFSVYGEATDVGEVRGMLPAARAPQVGVSNPNSLAAKAGVQTGFRVKELNGSVISTWENFEDLYAKLPKGASVQLKIESKSDQKILNLEFKKPENSTGFVGEDLGFYSSELFVEKVVPGSPAEAFGLKSGDRLVEVSGDRVQSFFDLRDSVQRSGEKEGKVSVAWEREGKLMTASITPTATSTRDVLLRKTTQYTIGILPMLEWAEPHTVIERVWNPFTLLFKGTERTVVFSWRNLVSIQKMITGDVSVSTLGGPILIGKIAGESLARGLIAFLTTMAILSVGLGVLNVLPIPVLDGGHLLLLGIESIRGKPLTIRQMEVIQQVGLSLILLLMVVVLKNDFSRLSIFN